LELGFVYRQNVFDGLQFQDDFIPGNDVNAISGV